MRDDIEVTTVPLVREVEVAIRYLYVYVSRTTTLSAVPKNLATERMMTSSSANMFFLHYRMSEFLIPHTLISDYFHNVITTGASRFIFQ